MVIEPVVPLWHIVAGVTTLIAHGEYGRCMPLHHTFSNGTKYNSVAAAALILLVILVQQIAEVLQEAHTMSKTIIGLAQ